MKKLYIAPHAARNLIRSAKPYCEVQGHFKGQGHYKGQSDSAGQVPCAGQGSFIPSLSYVYIEFVPIELYLRVITDRLILILQKKNKLICKTSTGQSDRWFTGIPG